MPDTAQAPDSRTAVGIKAYGRAGLSEVLSEMGQPAYRTGQILRWLYPRGATSFAAMTDLSSSLRESLAARFALPSLELISRVQSEVDATRKYLWRLADGTSVESVGIPGGDRLTVCFSTQVGCAMGCSFCATGTGGLIRNLYAGEMVDQIRSVGNDFGARVTNAVAMGQGEPFANYDAVIDACRLMNSSDGLGIGARHITISTCGLLPGIRRLATEPEQFTLAVSLHSAVQRTRDTLMPAVSGMPLERLREALGDYSATSGRRPSLEYALIDGVNDTDAQLRSLIRFCAGLSVHVNLIPVNPVSESGYRRSAADRATAFVRALGEAGIEASIRTERGADIDAACGQLRQRVMGG